MEEQRPKHEGQIGFRVPRELRTRLDRIHERHLTSDAGLFRALAEAFCAEAEKQHRVALPLKIQFAEVGSPETIQRRVLNESPSETAPLRRAARSAPIRKPA